MFMKFCHYLALFLLCSAANAQEVIERNLLQHFSQDEVAASLLPRDRWHPFPNTVEAWRAVVPDSIKQQIIASGEKYLHKPFAPLPATLYLEFKRTGNRTHYEDVSFGKRAQLFSLVLAESMEGKGRFTDDILNGVWSTCEETFWGVPAHYYLQTAGLGLPDAAEPSVDIFASETSEVLALTDYLVGPELQQISPLVRQRIYDEVNRRILVPLEKSAVPYSYLGPSRPDAPVNNWDPWVVSNWMISLLLLEKDQQRRVQELHHGMVLLDNYINGLGDDGAVDEGPSYWSGGAARLFDALKMLDNATEGKVTIYSSPVMQKLGSYIRNMHIAGNYFIDIADASPTISADGLLIYRVGDALGDASLKDFGAWAYHHIDDHNFYDKDFSKPRVLWNLLVVKDCDAANPPMPPQTDIWFRNLQLMAGASPKGLFLASHAGHNGESHNHNDVGDFMVYADGQPVIVDVGFGTYSAKTFSSDRYDLWYLNSAHHNVPLINGYQQSAGTRYGAHDVKYTGDAAGSAASGSGPANHGSGPSEKISLNMDIAKAYPDEAGVRQWLRKVTLDKSRNAVTVQDNFQLSKREGALSQTFMTVCPADFSHPGRIVFSIAGHRSVLLEYDAKAWDVKEEQMSTSEPDEKRVADNWQHKPIYRLLLTSKTQDKTGTFLYKIKQL
jgi:hypothetical protein